MRKVGWLSPKGWMSRDLKNGTIIITIDHCNWRRDMGKGLLAADQILLVLIIGGIAFVSGLSKDILWSGLKKLFVSGTENKPSAKLISPKNIEDCKDCLCLDRIKKCEICSVSMKKDSVGFNKDIEHMKKRLDRNDQEVEETRLAIHSIDNSLARLVTIVEERTKQGGLSATQGGT